MLTPFKVLTFIKSKKTWEWPPSISFSNSWWIDWQNWSINCIFTSISSTIHDVCFVRPFELSHHHRWILLLIKSKWKWNSVNMCRIYYVSHIINPRVLTARHTHKKICGNFHEMMKKCKMNLEPATKTKYSLYLKTSIWKSSMHKTRLNIWH